MHLIAILSHSSHDLKFLLGNKKQITVHPHAHEDAIDKKANRKVSIVSYQAPNLQLQQHIRKSTAKINKLRKFVIDQWEEILAYKSRTCWDLSRMLLMLSTLP